MGIVLACIIFVVIVFFISRSFVEHKKERISPQRQLKKPDPFCKDFEKKWNTGDLPCCGGKCNEKNPCSCPERLLCRDVVSKIVPDGHFVGQFWLSLPSGSRRIDFAVETPSGRKIAVELDGYETHGGNLEPIAFNDQLLRQNELVCAGWTVLRFSFDQLMSNAEQCRKLLYTLMAEDTAATFNKNPVLKATCPQPGCGGVVNRLKSKVGDFFWKCQKCNKTFNSNMIAPGLHKNMKLVVAEN